MTTEQAFHYRCTVLAMVKDILLNEKVQSDKKLQESILDHFMYLIAKYER